MTVETTDRKQSFAGGQGTLAFSFKCLPDFPEYIKVYVVTSGTQTLLTYNSDYTVALEPDGVGGVVTVSPTYSTNYTYTVFRETEKKQESDYDDYNQFPADTVESDYDRAICLAQEIAEDVSRSVKATISSGISNLELPAGEDGKALIWSGSTSIINSTYHADSLGTIALNAATTASAQATAAANSATESGNYATTASNAAILSGNYASTASTQATLAGNYATTASTSATLAGNYASTASTQATLAGNYASTASTQVTLAGNYATTASTQATLAGNYATTASAAAILAGNYAVTCSTLANAVSGDGTVNPTNLLSNGDFEAWSAGASAAPDGWALELTPTVARDIGDVGYGSYSAKITGNGAAVEGIKFTTGTLKPSTKYTLSVRVKATAGDTASIITTGATTNLALESTSTTFETKTGTLTTDASGTAVVIKLLAKADTDIVWFDGVHLCEGESAFAFSDKPASYLEGTWTPAVRGSGTAGTYELATATGTYIKVGKLVTLSAVITFASSITAGGDGALNITGVPFLSASSPSFQISGALGYNGVDTTDATISLAIGIGASSTTLVAFETHDNGSLTNTPITGVAANDSIYFGITYLAAT